MAQSERDSQEGRLTYEALPPNRALGRRGGAEPAL